MRGGGREEGRRVSGATCDGESRSRDLLNFHAHKHLFLVRDSYHRPERMRA